jgi:endonuclease YncB( thermonuclease family)
MHAASLIRFYLARRLAAVLALVLFGAPGFQPKAMALDDTAFNAGAAFTTLQVKAESQQTQLSQAGQAIELVRIFDGDSAIVRYEGETLHIRIAGIDAPEKGQPYADESRDRFVAFLKSPTARIDILKKDVFRRWLVRIEVNGEDLGETLLSEGNAWFFRRYQSDLSPEVRRRYDRAERDARARKRGLWHDSEPVAPWDYRASKRKPKN